VKSFVDKRFGTQNRKRVFFLQCCNHASYNIYKLQLNIIILQIFNLAKFVNMAGVGKRKADAIATTVSTDYKKLAGHWNVGLTASMHDPDLKIEEDELCVTIKDKYPKVSCNNCLFGLYVALIIDTTSMHAILSLNTMKTTIIVLCIL